MSASANWSDLPKRISVGVIVAAVVFSVMWYGGWLFVGLVALISAVLVWELVTMVESKSNAVPLAAFAATMLLFSAFVPSDLLADIAGLAVACRLLAVTGQSGPVCGVCGHYHGGGLRAYRYPLCPRGAVFVVARACGVSRRMSWDISLVARSAGQNSGLRLVRKKPGLEP